MEWNDEFSVSNDLIDSEHQRLFEMVRQIQQDLESGDERKLRVTTLSVLSNIYDHIHNHFLHEEELMSACNIPSEAVTRHKKDHDKWRSHLSRITEQANEMILASEDYSLIAVVKILLEANLDFLKEHFETFDMELRDYLDS